MDSATAPHYPGAQVPVAWAKQVIATGAIGAVTTFSNLRDYWIEKHVTDVRPPAVPTIRVVPLYLASPGALTCLKAQGHTGPHNAQAISLADLRGAVCGAPEAPVWVPRG